MSSTVINPRSTPNFAPPSGFRWLRRGEIITNSDYTVDQVHRTLLRPVTNLFSHTVGGPVGTWSSDLGDGTDILTPYCRKAPLMRLSALGSNNRRAPVLGLTYGAWFWYEIPFSKAYNSDNMIRRRASEFPSWHFSTACGAADKIGFPEWVTHYVEAGDHEFPPAPLTEKERLPALVERDRSIRHFMSVADPVVSFGYGLGFSNPGASLYDLIRSQLEKHNRVTEKIKVTLPVEPYAFNSVKLTATFADVRKQSVNQQAEATLSPTKLPTPNYVPAGWRKLVDGETVLDTDLYFSPELKRWLPRLGTKRVGKKYVSGVANTTIRKVEPPCAPKPTVTIPEFHKAAEKVLKVRAELLGKIEYRLPDSPLNPGPGYRLLYDFETPVPGDEYINTSSDSPGWKNCGATSPGTPSVGTRRKNIASEYDGKSGPEFFAYRRKLVDGQYPGDGYRLLAPHETLQAGDEYRRSTYSAGLWNPVVKGMAHRAEGYARTVKSFGDSKDDPIIVIRRKI